jgi:four helix bundle protein
MSRENAIRDKSKAFALQIIRLYRFLCEEKHEFVLSKQLLRSGTSIGANVREAQRGQSKPDFYSKMNIALKEADETSYWLELLYESGLLEQRLYESVYSDCGEMIKLLTAITKTQFK